jgi:flagellar hook-associated protein 1 FlgK
MSLNEILGSATSGLAAAQAGLRSVSNNIANVSTPGYARERVTLSTSVTGGRVTGVVVGEPSRIADRFLEATVYRRSGEFGRADVTASYVDRLQSLLGEPGAKSGLPARLDAISASAVAMTGGQGTAQTAAAFTAEVQDSITSMQQLSVDVTTLGGDVESEVGFTVDKINGLLSRIHDLNATVSSLGGVGRSTTGALDQRMSAVEELSGLIGITARDQPDGRVSIETTTGAVLLDRKLRQLSYPVGATTSQPVAPTIDIRFADASGAPGAATGEKLESAAAGGKLGGLLDLRDRVLPDFSEKLGVVFGGLAEALNAASNGGSAVPAPAELTGRNTGLVAADSLGFTGAATFAVTASDGTLVAKTRVDFSAMGAGATVADLVTRINSDLAGAATASFVKGQLRISATVGGNGVVVAQDAATPSARAGVGVSQYFGLNDLVRSDTSTLVPSGFTASDLHGIGAGETADFELRDSSGRSLTRYTLTGSAGPTVGDLVTELNASPLGASGSFSLDDRGRMRFAPAPSLSGAVLTIPTDTTDRFGTGRSISAMLAVNGTSSGLATAQVRSDVLANPGLLPLARFQDAAAVGGKALGGGDTRGATAFVDRLAQAVDLGKDGISTVERFSALLLGKTGLQASQAESSLANASARRDDAVNRRDSFSGVNIDEELAQMVVLQNSYSAAARVLTTASQMYDTLIQMIR